MGRSRDYELTGFPLPPAEEPAVGVLTQKVGKGWEGTERGRTSRGADEPVPAIKARGLGLAREYELAGFPPPPPEGEVGQVAQVIGMSAGGKPPYQLPMMADVERVRGSTGLTMVSTFSGCGGSCLGFEQAGYDVRYACEFVEAAREVYGLNHPQVYMDPRDVRAIRPAEVLAKLGLQVGELDVLEGSPPCANFSTAGAREKAWGKVKKYSDTKQRSDDLFFEFARLLEGLKPRAFVAENVSGLVKGKAYGYFIEIIRRLRKAGYRVEARLLDAQWLGVPQARQRVIFVGVREDLQLAPVFPLPLPYRYSMRDALPHLRRFSSSGHGYFPGLDTDGSKPAPTLPASREGSAYYKAQVEVERGPSLEGTAIGREWDKLKVGEQSERYFSLVKPNPDKPVPTVTATAGQRGAAGVTHPTEKRKFTIGELRALCAFPPDFRLVGTYEKQWERLGRSVPPRLMYHVARVLRDEVFMKLGRVRGGFSEAP